MKKSEFYRARLAVARITTDFQQWSEAAPDASKDVLDTMLAGLEEETKALRQIIVTERHGQTP